jgi:hypothetical protein
MLFLRVFGKKYPKFLRSKEPKLKKEEFKSQNSEDRRQKTEEKIQDLKAAPESQYGSPWVGVLASKGSAARALSLSKRLSEPYQIQGAIRFSGA